MRLTEEEFNDIISEPSAPTEEVEEPCAPPSQESEEDMDTPVEQATLEQETVTTPMEEETSQSTFRKRHRFVSHHPKHRRKHHSLLYWMSGGLIERFINSKWVALVVWIFFLFFCNVALGYISISQTKQISKLESELETVRNRQLFIKADISRLTREETMRMRLQSQNSTLTEKEDQPFVIYYGRDTKK